MPRWISGIVVVIVLLAMLPGAAVSAQSDVTPLRVEVAVTGTLTADQPTVVYSFNVLESLRMAVVFDVLSGDMQPSIVVLGQDQSTTLAGATGPNVNGLIVEFPSTGTYYVGITADFGYVGQLSADDQCIAGSADQPLRIANIHGFGQIDDLQRKYPGGLVHAG